MHENQIKAYEQSLEDSRNKEVMPYFFYIKLIRMIPEWKNQAMELLLD